MALLAGAVADRLNSSQDNDGWESDLSEESSPSSLSDKELVEKADEEPSVSYLTPTERSKSANKSKEKSNKKSSRQIDDEQPPSLPSPSESEIFAGRRTKRKGESIPFTPGPTSSSKSSTDVDDEESTRNDLIVTSTGRVQRKSTINSAVVCNSRKGPSSDDAEYTPQRIKKGHTRTSPRKTVCSLFDFETSTSKPQLTDELSDTNEQNPVLAVLKDISKTLNNLVDHVQNTEKEIKSVKKRLNSGSASSSDSSTNKAQVTIPNLIRVSVHAYFYNLNDTVYVFYAG